MDPKKQVNMGIWDLRHPVNKQLVSQLPDSDIVFLEKSFDAPLGHLMGEEYKGGLQGMVGVEIQEYWNNKE